MRRIRKPSRKAILIAALAAALCAAIAVGGLAWYGKMQAAKIPGLTFMDTLAYTTRDNPDAVITVGVIKDGKSSYTVYGMNGAELPAELHTYEIGSLTKTFTAAMIRRAADEGKIDIEAPIDRCLSLPADGDYPTIRQLVTHTSGYKGYYFETPMISSFFKGRNSFYGISKDSVLDRVARLRADPGEHGFRYSNFGYAVLGLALESAYVADYTALFNDFAGELGLGDTRISDDPGDLGRRWDWAADDAYLAAGAATSNIADMLRYAQMQIEGRAPFAACHERLEQIDAASDANKAMGIRMDGIGMAWILDEENGVVWHNGGTGHYNCYLGFRPETGTAVIVLSNLAPGYRIPATVMGIKLLAELDDR